MSGIFLIFPFFLLLQDVFMLPDEGDGLVHSISSHLKKAKHEIFIFTPVIDEYSIIRSLKISAKNDVRVTLVTGEFIQQDQNKTDLANKGNHLSLFKNISVYTLASFHHDHDSSSQLEGSLICIDNEELFIVTQALSTKKLKRNYAFAMHQQTACNTLFQPLLERAKPY